MNDEIKVLRKKIDDHEKRINLLEDHLKFIKEKEEDPLHNNACSKKLANAAHISENQLHHIFYIEEDDLSLVCSFKGPHHTNQFKATLVLLTAYKYCRGVGHIKSAELNQKLKEVNIGSLSALSGNLAKEEYKKFIRKEGKAGSHAFVYKITHLGLEKGLKIIRELAEEEIE